MANGPNGKQTGKPTGQEGKGKENPVLKALDMKRLSIKGMHLGAFGSEEARKPDAKQTEAADSLAKRLEAINMMLRSRAKVVVEHNVAGDPLKLNDGLFKSEVHRMCVALYSIEVLKQIYGKAEAEGTSAHYNLFIEAASYAARWINYDFYHTTDSELYHGFIELQGRLDACAVVFGIESKDIEEVTAEYRFPLTRLAEEELKAAGKL